MWTRKELKEKGKMAFKANYWRSVLVALLASIAAGASVAGSGRGLSKSAKKSVSSSGLTQEQAFMLLGAISVAAFFAILISVAIEVFALNPLMVGCVNFFIKNSDDPSTEINTLERGFKANYKNVCMVKFMTKLFIFLWSLLLVIPGIYKSYEYYLVSYLLAENPDMDYKEAQATSKQLMYGHKWNTFVLELSFIGWIILGALTCGIVMVFYTQPYMEATQAELYLKLAHPERANTVNYEVHN